MNKIHSFYDSKSCILRVRFLDIITLELLLEHCDEVLTNTNYPSNLKIILETQRNDHQISTSDIDTIVEKLNQITDKYENIYEAIIVNGPVETVIATIILEKYKKTNYHGKIFSTFQAAEDWIKHIHPC